MQRLIEFLNVLVICFIFHLFFCKNSLKIVNDAGWLFLSHPTFSSVSSLFLSSFYFLSLFPFWSSPIPPTPLSFSACMCAFHALSFNFGANIFSPSLYSLPSQLLCFLGKTLVISEVSVLVLVNTKRGIKTPFTYIQTPKLVKHPPPPNTPQLRSLDHCSLLSHYELLYTYISEDQCTLKFLVQSLSLQQQSWQAVTRSTLTNLRYFSFLNFFGFFFIFELSLFPS